MKAMLLTEFSQPTGKVYVQPKLNGIRCIIDTAFGDMYTKTGNKINGLDYLAKKWTGHLERYIDGEIYVHGLSWEEIFSKFKTGAKDLEFHAFDIINKNEFSNRSNHIDVETKLINASEIKKYHKIFLLQGYEGTVIRNPDGDYTEGRSIDCMKLKDYYDFEAIVYDGNTMETENGLYFEIPKSKINFSDDDVLTIKCDGIKTGGLPINPVAIKNHGQSIRH